MRCHLIIPPEKEFRPIINSLNEASKDLEVRLTLIDLMGGVISEPRILSKLVSEITMSDLVIAEVSQFNNPNIFYGIGLVHAMGKQVLFLIEEETS